VGGPENGNFPLLYVMKMSLRRGWVVLKSLKTPLRNIKMAPNWDELIFQLYHNFFSFDAPCIKKRTILSLAIGEIE